MGRSSARGNSDLPIRIRASRVFVAANWFADSSLRKGSGKRNLITLNKSCGEEDVRKILQIQ